MTDIVIRDNRGEIRGFVRHIGSVYVAYAASGAYRGRYQRREAAERALARKPKPTSNTTTALNGGNAT